MNSLVNGLKEGVINLFKNRLFTLASIGTITTCLFLFGVCYCLVANMQYIFLEVETTVGVTVFFEEKTSEARILEIKADLEQQEAVDNVHYTSAEEAWEAYKEKAFPEGDNEILTNMDNDNPLADSASLEVYLKDPAAQDTMVEYIAKTPDVRTVNASESLADSFTSFGRLISYVSLGLIVILIAVAVFLISNTVTLGITVRKEEIAIMKYIGATDFFVRAPFLVEGILIGVIGSAIPVVILKVLYEQLVIFMDSHFRSLSNILNFLPSGTVFGVLAPVSLVIGLGIGFLGSYVTTIKHVRV